MSDIVTRVNKAAKLASIHGLGGLGQLEREEKRFRSTHGWAVGLHVVFFMAVFAAVICGMSHSTTAASILMFAASGTWTVEAFVLIGLRWAYTAEELRDAIRIQESGLGTAADLAKTLTKKDDTVPPPETA